MISFASLGCGVFFCLVCLFRGRGLPLFFFGTSLLSLHLLNCLYLDSQVFLVTLPLLSLILQQVSDQVAGGCLAASWGQPSTPAKLLKLVRMASTVKKER